MHSLKVILYWLVTNSGGHFKRVAAGTDLCGHMQLCPCTEFMKIPKILSLFLLCDINADKVR